MAQVAMIGLGRMGFGMAGRLLEAGHDLVVANRTPHRAVPLLARGARLAASPAEAVRDADAVVVMVSDDAASETVWLGEDGVLAGSPRTGAFAIECSTLSHEWVLRLAAEVSAAGLRYLDAPVTGLPDAAAQGRLTLLVGAARDDLDAAGPILEPLAERVVHFGAVGTGTAYKLIVNLMGAVQIAGAAEGLALAERAGLDPALFADTVATGQPASPQVVRNLRRMVAGDHDRDVTFSAALRRKDTDYAVRFARQLAVGAPLGSVALTGLERLLTDGRGSLNESAVIEVARDRRPS
ncbi:MAG: NAD(P)-dependent oxidoreductase [Micropruina sp.]|uniref:NAD(P)-dependent oxidoreductase n=1 Tax=Micropruina sp. TaxID=2737536 RepID=UPI0039E60152